MLTGDQPGHWVENNSPSHLSQTDGHITIHLTTSFVKSIKVSNYGLHKVYKKRKKAVDIVRHHTAFV